MCQILKFIKESSAHCLPDHNLQHLISRYQHKNIMIARGLLNSLIPSIHTVWLQINVACSGPKWKWKYFTENGHLQKCLTMLYSSRVVGVCTGVSPFLTYSSYIVKVPLPTFHGFWIADPICVLPLISRHTKTGFWFMILTILF